MRCTRLAENTGRKSDAKNRHLGTIAQFCRAVSSQLRHISTIGKKIVKQQCLLHMFPQYGELRPTSGWDRLAVLGHPSKFQLLSLLGFITAATSLNGSQPNFVRCSAVFAENIGRNKVAKNRHLGTIARICRTISSQVRHVSTIGKTC